MTGHTKARQCELAGLFLYYQPPVNEVPFYNR